MPRDDSFMVNRVIEVMHPKRVCVMVSIEGYFDESGDFEEEPGIFCISGYFLTKDAALKMDAEWRGVLSDHDIPFFHMVDCAHGNGVFSEKSKKERIEIQTKLINIIKKYVLEGFSVIARKEDFEETEENPNPYTACAETCIESLKIFLKINRIDGDIAYFFETGHSDKQSASGRMMERLREDTDSLAFVGKKQAPILQAADILAWQTRKYVQDRIVGERPPRKDFESLMERDHNFFYVNLTEKKTAAIELWPVSKRSQFATQSMSVNKDGPVPFMIIEGEEDVPVIMVGKTLGWRPAWGRMVYVAFETFEDKKFALGFTEEFMWEALLSFLGATEVFNDSELCPVLPAEDVLLDKQEDGTVLRLKMSTGVSMAFNLSDEMVEKLKKILIENPSSQSSS